MVITRSKTKRINQFQSIWKQYGLDWYNFKPYLAFIGWKPISVEEYHRIKKRIDNITYNPKERLEIINNPELFTNNL